jgi:galactokinase
VSRAAVETLFSLAFGGRPTVVTSAPGRVNLIGEHVDYNGGAVLPIGIAARTWVAMSRARAGTSRAVSRERGEVGEWAHGQVAAGGAWWDYVEGALVAAESLGATAVDRDVAVVSEVPMGAGLSSSAALEVATVLAALACDGIAVSSRPDAGPATPSRSLHDVARAAHAAETGYVKVACGIMDQYASALARQGHALHLQCDTAESRAVPFTRGVLIVDTMTPRELRRSAYNERRAECDSALAILRRTAPSLATLAQATPELLAAVALPEPEAKRARHVVSEVRRVEAFVQACAPEGDPAALGPLLNASHRSLRDDYECSTPELDWVVEHSVARVGIDGARLTGAGWGGCAIVVGDPDALAAFIPEITASFEVSWGRAPRTWLTTPQDGARLER